MFSKLKRLLLCFALIAASATSCALAVSQEEREFYIQGTSGPYRGRVIDARTKQPIPGAVVVAAWYHDVYALVQNNEEFYDAVEVLTDDTGNFIVDAPDIERRAPWRTTFPVFTVFNPGYTYFQGWLGPVEALPERSNKLLLKIVELEPSITRSNRERLKDLPLLDTRIPDEKIPRLLKAVAEERNRLLR